MADRDSIDITITLANGATTHLNITTNLHYHHNKVTDLLDKAINSIKESSE